jgi:hypothetical protein
MMSFEPGAFSKIWASGVVVGRKTRQQRSLLLPLVAIRRRLVKRRITTYN